MARVTCGLGLPKYGREIVRPSSAGANSDVDALAPAAREGLLPKLHYVLSILGLALFMIGLHGVAMGSATVLFAVIGSLTIVAGFLVFVWIVFRARIA